MIHANEPFSDAEDANLPIPLLVAKRWDFPLQYHVVNGVYYYAIIDWIAGLTNCDTLHASNLWGNLRRSIDVVESPISIMSMSYDDGYHEASQRYYTNESGLNYITINLRSTRKRRTLIAIKRFLFS